MSSSPNFEDFFQLEISQNQIVIDADEKAFDQLVIVVEKHQNVFARRGYLRFHLLKARQKKNNKRVGEKKFLYTFEQR